MSVYNSIPFSSSCMVLLSPMFHIAITENSEFWKHVPSGPLGISMGLSWRLPELTRSRIETIIFSSKSVFLLKLLSPHTGAIMHMVAQTRTPTIDASLLDYPNLIHRLLYWELLRCCALPVHPTLLITGLAEAFFSSHWSPSSLTGHPANSFPKELPQKYSKRGMWPYCNPA